VDRLAPFVALIRESRPLPVRLLASAVFELFDRFDVRTTLSAWMASAERDNSAHAAMTLQHRDEHEQVWTNLVELFEQMVDLLGEQTMSGEEFVEVLESGLEHFDLALTP